ncbi:30S ribosomal protein S2 [Williamsoniiplasma luminosum]|uniref:Small ribosomal subunit protein uS2 n=1 Tax=Williamsoniiplasma luminosum TaxID=214888 RepID=A0A2K8NUN5_9MOLU|nr:30S ribosomal protein S2 [Williamsoniiplasma luminosum]ATZ17477.1 30S ribosomal protein S2 [Williamsoniiplasma luminosum]AVP49287.1 MAG: 30S ribosomal protein S2 [Williamsoniiplasma luminosum]
MSQILTREELSQAGVQYGHQTKRWNPKMAPYIFGVNKKNHIIDLQKTMDQLAVANGLIETIAKQGGNILFVGTKKTAKLAVKEAALRSGNFYVNERWLGGTLTNMKTISSRIKALWIIEKEEADGKLALRTKKEQIGILKEKAKLERTLGGIKQMRKLPAVLVVVDPKTDEIAVKEAMKLNIPVIALVDTNMDPDMVSIPVPANDDMAESINIIVNNFVDTFAAATNLTMVPSALKTVVTFKPREEGEEQGRRPYYKRDGEFKRDGDFKKDGDFKRTWKPRPDKDGKE